MDTEQESAAKGVNGSKEYLWQYLSVPWAQSTIGYPSACDLGRYGQITNAEAEIREPLRSSDW